MNMKFYKLRRLYVDNDNYFNYLLDKNFFSSTEHKYYLVVNTTRIFEKFSEIKSWQQKYENEKQRTHELENIIYDLKSIDENSSKLVLEIEQLKNKQTDLISLNEELKKAVKEKEELNEKLQKHINELISVKGIVDKFGTYKSLMKDFEIVNYFLKKPKGTSIRWKELDEYFKSLGWPKSTILCHLKRLHDLGLLKYQHGFKGEYILDLSSTEYNGFLSDIDILIKFILGEDLYQLIGNK
jgi:DNA repair ATPase RecN